MVSPEFAALIKIGSERTYTTQIGLVRSTLFVFFGLLNLIAALLEWFFPALPFLPHPVVSIVFSLPLFLYAAVYSCIRSFNKLTLCSAGIRFRYHEILWSEILSIKESNHGLLTLEVEEKQGLVRIPLAGMQSLDEIRKTISEHVEFQPISLPIASPSHRTLFFILLIPCLEVLLFIVLVKLMNDHAARPLGLQTIGYFGITWLAFHVVLGSTVQPYSRSRLAFASATRVNGEGIRERVLFFKNKKILYGEVLSLKREPETNERAEGLTVKSQNHEITIDSHFPNYPQVVEEICRRTGLEVQDA
jgi:hypothetical protein